MPFGALFLPIARRNDTNEAPSTEPGRTGHTGHTTRGRRRNENETLQRCLENDNVELRRNKNGKWQPSSVGMNFKSAIIESNGAGRMARNG